VTLRARELDIDLVYQRCHNKLSAYNSILKRLSLTDQQVAYIGDDIVDLPVLSRVGFSATVADADPEVLAQVLWISDYPGGFGAVRQLCQLILQAKGLWPDVMRRYQS
jgi:3-deoxy-D-manno-octulosonate 8-phosphate phosphatase (KDO 8-P phosphatase)